MSSSGRRLSDSTAPSTQLSPQEVRARRAMLFSKPRVSTTSSSPSTAQDPKTDAGMTSTTSRRSTRDHDSHAPSDLSDDFLSSFHGLMWDPTITSDADQKRWNDEGIRTFAMSEGWSTNSGHDGECKGQESHWEWGIIQTHGGPCGVLAVIQAEIIRIMDICDDVHKRVGRKSVEKAIATCIGILLSRCAVADSVDLESGSGSRLKGKQCVEIVLPSSSISPSLDKNNNDGLKCVCIQSDDTNSPANKKCKGQEKEDDEQSKFQSLADATTTYLLQNDRMELFYSPGGVILLVMSLVQTRGIQRIQNDMDDPSSHLTAQFGQCSQEIMNLLLTGQATSNTFDNTLTLGGGTLKCHGIQSQSSIGYLSQLEALRYCSVGSYFKSPKNPIWVCGSTSHFTVLFGPKESLIESESDILLDRCRRAFKSVEGAEDNGFIPIHNLKDVLKHLDLDLGSGEAALGASLEMSGSGIILWSDFWKATSRLLTGAKLDNVLSTGSGHMGPLPQQQSFSEHGGGQNSHGNVAVGVESDEELAKRLAAEWGGEQSWGGNLQQSISHKSDEEFARELQAQFEVGGAGNVVNILDPDAIITTSTAPTRSGNSVLATTDGSDSDQGRPFPNTNGARHKDAEVYEDDSFPMHHYNSLRGGALTSFRVTRLSSKEAVGMAVALSVTSTDAGVGGSHEVRGDSADLEAVVRTKYPSCTFDWGNKNPASLH